MTNTTHHPYQLRIRAEQEGSQSAVFYAITSSCHDFPDVYQVVNDEEFTNNEQITVAVSSITGADKLYKLIKESQEYLGKISIEIIS